MIGMGHHVVKQCQHEAMSCMHVTLISVQQLLWHLLPGRHVMIIHICECFP